MNDMLLDTDQRVAALAKALAHPARVAILRTLAERACICGEIVEVLGLAQSTVSQHLRVLKQAGWVNGEVDGPRTCYRLDRAGVAALRFVLDPMLDDWASSPAACGCDCCTDGTSCTCTLNRDAS